MKYTTYILAQAATYDCGVYNAGSFGRGSCESASSSASGGGMLVDAGYDVIVPLALAGAIIIASCIYVLRRALRRRR